MSTLEERLQRQEWNPAPEDTLIGTITEIKVREAKSGNLYPILIVKDADDAEHIVSCALMASDVIAARPVPGDRVGVRFDGPQPKANGDGTWDKYVIEFEAEPAAINWDTLAAGRGLAAAVASPARTAEELWSEPEPAGFGDQPGEKPPF